MKIAMTSISVRDPIEAFMFYTQKLGFKEKLFMPEMKLAIVVSPEDEDGTSLLLEHSETSDRTFSSTGSTTQECRSSFLVQMMLKASSNA